MARKKQNNNFLVLGVIFFSITSLIATIVLTQNNQDTRRMAGGCVEQCPGGDGVLRSCSPPEDDGSSADSMCAWAGRTETCGGQSYCCPSAGGTWTTNMTACAVATPTPIPTVAPTFTPTPMPTEIPTPTPIASRFLKFKMSFQGIYNEAECADAEKLPLTIVVMTPKGVGQSFANVTPTKVSSTTAKSLAVYEVGLELEKFAYSDGITVFIKGPKHLQVKYGKNSQNSFYNKSGGELAGLTTSESTTPVFDFTGYPLLAGDVTGATNEVQDGMIDGLDFSYIKNEAIKRTEVTAHSYMLADLNGNCKMESSDLASMMLSLVDKQEQVY